MARSSPRSHSRSARPSTIPRDGRAVAAAAIARAAEVFPRLGARAPVTTEHAADLPPRDARLAAAVHRLTMQRWLTLRHLLNAFLNKPLDRLEPAMQGVLLTAAAQILFMSRMPSPAVVDASVELARRMVRPGAAALANAVLRKVADLVLHVADEADWSPAADRIPLETGFIALREPILPAPEDLAAHLAVATSCPQPLVRTFIDQHGPDRALALCLAGLRHPPTIVAVERGFDPAAPAAMEIGLRPHVQRGYVLWPQGQTGLADFLAAHPVRRVQDPASAAPVNTTADLKPRVIVDYCAGRGTKTLQLTKLHSDARIIAADIDPDCRAALERTFANHQRVSVAEPEALLRGRVPDVQPGSADLLVLDVPCSNTGVLARRPEARYRFSAATLQSLRQVQQRIIDESLPLLAEGGHVLYATCSICQQEKRDRVDWMTRQCGLTLVREQLRLPQGRDDAYRDGGYDALLVKA
jgi:16S rRNA (cytosine967-C5)-methyltransferase